MTVQYKLDITVKSIYKLYYRDSLILLYAFLYVNNYYAYGNQKHMIVLYYRIIVHKASFFKVNKILTLISFNVYF